MSLRLPDSGANTGPDGRRFAASTARNAEAILQVLLDAAPKQGRLLEIASGTGQHAALFAAALPGLEWHPTDLNPDNMASITAWSAHSGTANLRAPVAFDATRPGWSADWPQMDAVLLVNLLHLIPAPAIEILLSEAAKALAPNGTAFFYGPFLRDGQTTSPGDASFDASLRAQDPAIGYKDLAWVQAVLADAGLHTTVQQMPANNMMVIARR